MRIRAPFFVSTLTAVMLLASCGGGGGGSGTPNSTPAATNAQQSSQLQVAITDAPGDFLEYTVDIKSISLKKVDGTEVQTIPITSRIDFTQYTDLTELFNILTVPVGSYSEVDLNLDYSNKEILIENSTGDEVSPKVVDADGNNVGLISLKLQFPNDETLKIAPGVPAQLSIDFDLNSSNDVDVAKNTVTVEPILYASTKLNENRDHRVRGLLEKVDTTANSFNVDLLPLYLRKSSFGNVDVFVDANTDWLINGTKYTGLEGVAVLAALPKDTPIISLTRINDTTKKITAKNVYAGTSVPWIGRDAVQGVVISRTADTLTVRGRAIQVGEDATKFSHYENIPVTLSSATEVTRQVLHDTGLTKQDVSIGQRVTVFGDLTKNASDKFSMDASHGHVHMEINQIEGEVVTRSPLVMNLEEINGRSPRIFNFSGTGSSPLTNSDPSNYSIDTGVLSLADISVDEFVKVRGFVTPFGSAPKDFIAQTIIDPNQQKTDQLIAVWNPSENTHAILATGTNSVELNTDEGNHGVLYVQIFNKDGVVSNDPATLTLVPDDDGQGNYVVKSFRDFDMTVFHNFETFEALIKDRNDMGQKLVSVQAVGKYHADTHQFEVSNGNAVFKKNDGHVIEWTEDENPGKHKGEKHKHKNKHD